MKTNDTTAGLPNYDFMPAMELSMTDYARHTVDHVDETCVGVAPCFTNPEARHYAMQKLNGTDVLFIDGRPAIFPGHEIGDALSQRLTNARETGTDPDFQMVEVFTLPHRYHADEHAFNPQMQPCYLYQGHYYVHHLDENQQHHWFECDPIRVKQQPDGSLQARDVLFIAKFNRQDLTDLDWAALTDFMNQRFLPELERNSLLPERQFETKRTKLQPGFTREVLKDPNTAMNNCGPECDYFSNDGGAHYMCY